MLLGCLISEMIAPLVSVIDRVVAEAWHVKLARLYLCRLDRPTSGLTVVLDDTLWDYLLQVRRGVENSL